MAAVEQAQLHRLERRDIGDELRAGVFPARARAGEAVLDDPRDERLGDDRRGIGNAEKPRGLGHIVVRRRGHDAIDHRARKRHVRADPLRERGIDGLRVGTHDALDGAPVVRKIVAAERP